MNDNNNSLLIKVITPINLIAQVRANIATFPGEEGEFGVMMSHMPMLVNLKPGIIKIITSSNEEIKFFVFGGIAQVKENEVNVITEYAFDLKSINKHDTQEKINNLQLIIANHEDNIETNQFVKELTYLNSLNSFLS